MKRRIYFDHPREKKEVDIDPTLSIDRAMERCRGDAMFVVTQKQVRVYWYDSLGQLKSMRTNKGK